MPDRGSRGRRAMSPSNPVQAGGNRLRRQRITTAALALLGFLACATPAWADHSSGELGIPGLTERQLRAFERATLGPGHAAEHARLRRAERDGQLTPAEPAVRAGVQAAAALAGPPEQVGRWGTPFPIPVMGIHAAMLPTGKVMWFSYPQNPSRGGREWDCAEHRAGVAVGSGDRRYEACRSAVVARSRRRRAQAGQHLVRRPDLHRRRPVGGVRRQPGVLERVGCL